MSRISRLLALMATLCWICGAAPAQEVSVTGHVDAAGKPPVSNSTVVWLKPVSGSEAFSTVVPMKSVLRQKNKSFQPHLLVVTRGSTVEFPNEDPWFHNVFSLFNGKRFDLGLYEAGTSRTVHFDREGVSYIFCNIHSEMSAVVVVLPSNHFAIPDKRGDFSIPDVPPGRYVLHVWAENVQPHALLAQIREVQISDTAHTVGALHIPTPPSTTLAHKNKYDQDYEPPSPNNPVYVQQP
jgi:plastocyanin